MHYLKEHRTFYNRILRLDDHERQHPTDAVFDFMAGYELREVRLLLHQLVAVALTSKNEVFKKPKRRTRVARFAQDLEKLVEAVHLLHDGKGERSGKEPLQ